MPLPKFMKGAKGEAPSLWVEIDGDLTEAAELLVQHPQMFMIEHAAPGTVRLNLTAYISLIHDIRRF